MSVLVIASDHAEEQIFTERDRIFYRGMNFNNQIVEKLLDPDGLPSLPRSQRTLQAVSFEVAQQRIQQAQG